jgi:hypothetical protein
VRDSLDSINAILLTTTTNEATSFTLLQRTTNRRFDLPAEPQLSPDRQHLVTADICAKGCSNEIAVWRVSRDGLRKELAWSPGPAWIDAAAAWKDADTLTIEYTVAGQQSDSVLERKLADPAWKRLPPGCPRRTRHRGAGRSAASCCGKATSPRHSVRRTRRCCRTSAFHSHRRRSISACVRFRTRVLESVRDGQKITRRLPPRVGRDFLPWRLCAGHRRLRG